MLVNEIIKRLKKLQRFEPDMDYMAGSPVAEEAKDGDYVSWWDVEELIKEIEERCKTEILWNKLFE